MIICCEIYLAVT